MKIPAIAFESLNQLLRLQTGLTFKVSRQTLYNYKILGVPPDRFAALLFCLQVNGVEQSFINRTLEHASCENAIDMALDQLLEIPF